MGNQLFRLLLLLYPASFRAEYGKDWRSDVAMRRRSAGGFALWAEIILDTLWNALCAHAEILWQDIRWSIRWLAKTPGFTCTAIAVAAIGIGATVSVFTLADHVLIRPLPFRDPDRLVKVWERTPNYGRLEASPANFRDWLAMDPPFEQLAAWRSLSTNVSGSGEPRMIEGAAMTANMLPMLGVQPLLGRVFTPEDDRPSAPMTVLLAWNEWRDHYGSDQSVIGRKIILDGTPAEVIGVMPPWFRYPTRRVNLWTPIRFTPDDFADRTNTFLLVVGRLKEGMTLAEADLQMNVIAARLQRQYPDTNADTAARVYRLKDEIPQQSRQLLYALTGAAAAVLLIACTNLANLLLARAAARRKELAIRTALGAGRERLTRQLLTESLLLSLLGGGFGAALGLTLLPLLAKLVPTMLPLPETPSPDLRVWLLCGIITILTGVVFGFLPALLATCDTASSLAQGGRSGSLGARGERVRSVLVVAEITACAVLLAGSGLLLRALGKLQDTDLGFQMQDRLTLRTSLPLPKYETVARREAFYSRVLSETAALPGVRSAAYTSFLPIAMGGGIFEAKMPGDLPDKNDRHFATIRFITPDYFRAMGIPMLAGRAAAPQDTQSAPLVAIVSRSFVERFLGGEPNAALGRTFEFAFFKRTIVGVVGDVRVRGRERPSEPQVYLPHRQVPDGWLPSFTPKDLVVHTTDLPATLAAVTRIIASADPEQPVSMVRSLEDVVATDTEGRTTQIYVLSSFAVFAFLLAAVGIHGLLAFAVSQRRQEIGVRMALGARPRNILQLVMMESLLLSVLGLCLGLGLAYSAGRALQSLLAGVSPFDPVAFGSAITLCGVMTILGSLGPVLRALRVDPVESMRTG